MSVSLPPSEKRSFFLYLFVVFFTTICLFLGKVGLAIAAITLGFFGLFRLTYFFEEELKNIPSFLSLPARILFGINEKENSYRQNILSFLRQRNVIVFFAFGFLYVSWVVFCGLNVTSHEDISRIFGKNLPVIPAMSYVNIYETVQGILWISIVGLIIFISFTYAQSMSLLKNSYIFFLPLFMGFLILLLWQSDFIFSLPPLYTGLIQGIGAGKGDILLTHQADIFLYPPTELFMRYIEVGLIGLIIFFVLFLVPLLTLLKTVIRHQAGIFYPFCGILVFLSLFIVDSFVIDPAMVRPLQSVGFALIGLAWGSLKTLK